MRRQLLTSVTMVVLVTLVCGFAYPLALTGIGSVAFAHQADGSLVTSGGRVVGSSLLGQAFVGAGGGPAPSYFQGRPSATITSPATFGITESGASNLGPSNPLLIGFVPGVNTVGLDGRPSATNPFATPADPFCVPVEDSRSAEPVTRPAPGQRYARNPDGTYVCDPETVPERAITYRADFGLAPRAPVPVDAVTASGSGLDPDISIANADLQAPALALARNLPLAEIRRLITANTTGRSLGLFGDPGVDVLTLNIALDTTGARRS